MNLQSFASPYSPAEELANSLTHGVGVVLSIAGLAVLVGFASVFGTAWHIVSCSIYGATQIALYTASTLYHSIPLPRAKAVLRLLDHAAIFLFIAGSYTPFALVNLRGPWGWSILVIIWAAALAGVVMQNRLMHQRSWVTALPYVVMGWVVVMAIEPLTQTVAPSGIALLVAGGAAYTLGVVFYAWRRLPFSHAIWHGFVLVGSALHFFAVLFYVIPLAA